MITKQEFIAFGHIVDAAITAYTMELDETEVTRLLVPTHHDEDEGDIEIEWYSPDGTKPVIRASTTTPGPQMTITGHPDEWVIEQTPDDGNLLTTLERIETRSDMPVATVSKYGPPADFGVDGIKLFPHDEVEPEGDFLLEDVLEDMDDES